MYTYLISYDLMTPGKRYLDLHKHLEGYSDWARPLESVWLVRSKLDVVAIRNAARIHMDDNDKILVVDITGRVAAWKNLPEDVSSWINNNV